MFNFVGLLYSYANANAIHAGLDEDLFIFIARDRKRIKKHLRRVGCLNFWHVMSFNGLRSKVGDRERGSQG